MTCDHCKATVENGLKELEGVSEAMADRVNKLVSVESEGITEQQIKEAIERMGYSYTGKV